MTNDHDALFRHVFSQPEHAISLLRSALPGDVAAAIDWPSLRLVAGTSVDEGLRDRHADLLFTAQIGDSPVLLYVLVEHKSADEPLAAFQLLRYDRWRDLFQAVWAHPDGRAAVYALFSYLASRLDVDAERFAAAGAHIHEGARQMGKSLADRLHEQGFQAGLAKGQSLADRLHEQGVARGETRGKAEALLTLLRARFGAVPDTLAAQIAGQPPAALDALIARAATASSLAAVFA